MSTVTNPTPHQPHPLNLCHRLLGLLLKCALYLSPTHKILTFRHRLFYVFHLPLNSVIACYPITPYFNLVHIASAFDPQLSFIDSRYFSPQYKSSLIPIITDVRGCMSEVILGSHLLHHWFTFYSHIFTIFHYFFKTKANRIKINIPCVSY